MSNSDDPIYPIPTPDDVSYHPTDDEPKLCYCERCCGDTLHSWTGTHWKCDSCGSRR